MTCLGCWALLLSPTPTFNSAGWFPSLKASASDLLGFGGGSNRAVFTLLVHR